MAFPIEGQKKIIDSVVVDTKENPDGVLTMVFTRRIVDRDSEVMEPMGVQLDNFKKNPVYMWAHQYSIPPIGKVLTDTIDVSKKEIVGNVEFDMLDPFAALVYGKYKGRFMNANSVGFRPLEFGKEQVLEGQMGLTIMAWELLELSGVPIPANPEALRREVTLVRACSLMESKGVGFLDEYEAEMEGDIVIRPEAIEPCKGLCTGKKSHEFNPETSFHELRQRAAHLATRVKEEKVELTDTHREMLLLTLDAIKILDPNLIAPVEALRDDSALIKELLELESALDGSSAKAALLNLEALVDKARSS